MQKARLMPLVLLFLAAGLHSGSAQPDFRRSQILEGLRVYRDAYKPAVYFYEPGELTLATGKDKKPDFQFLDMRYTGHRSADDQNVNRIRSLLRFRVVLTPHSKASLDMLKESLRKTSGSVEVRPLPIRRLDAVLVCTAGPTDSLTMTGGHFENPEASLPADHGTYWKERTFVLKLNDKDAQLLRSMFVRQQVAISVGYAFFADCISWNADQVELSASAGLKQAVLQVLLPSQGSSSDSNVVTRPVKMGSFEIVVDATRWPDLLARADINEQLEPEYALLDIYCFDFANNARADLYSKKVVVEAIGVNGKPIQTDVTFCSEEPDQYARSIRFPYAVRIDRPFRYKVVEISQNGDKTESAWTEQSSWTSIVNVTTPASGSQPSPSSNRITK